ncbi:MAG: molecular chaperone DnaJ [Myxococcota bacterium]
MERDYYEVLGLAREASPQDIKKAYKKAARKFHPDLNRDDPSAEGKFKEASEAYEILSDDEKRRIYDQFGHEGLKGRGFEPNFTDFGDILSELFGGGGFGDLFGRRRGGGGGQRRARRGADLEYPMRLTFMEAAHGVAKVIEIPRHVHCDTCSGSGLRPGAQSTNCGTCGGQGEVIQAQGFLRIRTVCPACRGAGKTVDPGDRCEPCSGSGRVRETDEMEIKVPGGSYSGLQIRHTGKGEIGDPGAPPGDLYVTLEVEPHEVFKRDGADVYVTVPVPYPVMCLGGEITIPTVHGEEPLEVARGTESGSVVVLRGKGVDQLRRRSSRGDHHVRLVVNVPKTLSEEQEELLRRLAELEKVGVQQKGFWARLFG